MTAVKPDCRPRTSGRSETNGPADTWVVPKLGALILRVDNSMRQAVSFPCVVVGHAK